MKLLAALLCALMLILSVPVAAHAADDVYTEGTLYYTIGDETVTIVGCFGRKDEVTVPASIAGYPVNTIGSGAFMTNRYLKKLNLPDTITVIEDGAIAEGIRVIYNANTDHPQGEPTDIITGREPIRTPSKSDATQPTKSADKQPTTSAAKGADATKAAPAPTNAGGDKVIEGEVNLVDEEASEAAASAAAAASGANGAVPVTDANGSVIPAESISVPLPVAGASATTDESAGGSGAWLIVAIIAAVGAAAAIVAVVVIRKKRSSTK